MVHPRYKLRFKEFIGPIHNYNIAQDIEKWCNSQDNICIQEIHYTMAIKTKSALISYRLK